MHCSLKAHLLQSIILVDHILQLLQYWICLLLHVTCRSFPGLQILGKGSLPVHGLFAPPTFHHAHSLCTSVCYVSRMLQIYECLHVAPILPTDVNVPCSNPWHSVLQILSEDYSKAVFLCMDRSLNFHARGGQHFATRVPKFGRTLAYLPQSAEIVVGGSAAELWRVNLHEGRFMAPVPVAARAVNALGVSPAHGMLAAGVHLPWVHDAGGHMLCSSDAADCPSRRSGM